MRRPVTFSNMPKNTSIQASFQSHAEAKGFFLPGEKVFVACSGGPDSTALFLLLRELAPSLKLKLGILHFDHRLRKTSARDVKFVRKLAKRARVPFVLGTAPEEKEKKLSLEEAARQRRYDFFIRSAKRLKISKIAFAHTLDDQAETILMRLVQGTGPRGLLGIREILKMQGAVFVRPLLNYSKKEILRFLKEKEADFCRDETNAAARFLRNRIRLKLLPLLRAHFNPNVDEALSRFPAILKDEQDLLSGLEEKGWKSCLKRGKKNEVVLRRKAFERVHPALQFRLLDKALKQIHPASGLGFETWNLFLPHLRKKKSRLSFSKGIDLFLEPSKLVFSLK